MFAAVSSHGTIIGTAREIALIEFFRGLIPQRYEVLSGAIASETGGRLDKASGQLDVMIVDTLDYPTVLRAGDLAIALAASVRVVVESKSDLDAGSSFFKAMRQIGKARLVAAGGTLTALFCFGAPAKPTTLRSWLDGLVKERRRLLSAAKAADQKLMNYNRLSAAEKAKRKKPRTKTSLMDEANLYSAAALPDVIVSDQGAIAIRTDDKETYYRFYRPKGDSPSIVALASSVLGHISQGLRSAGGAAHAQQTQSFRLLMDHFDAGFERASNVSNLDVTDPQPSQ